MRWLLLFSIILSGCNVDKSFIFFPDPTVRSTPADIGIPFEDIYITTKDNVRINAWYVPHPQGKATLLWFHGNGGNLGDRVDQLKKFHPALPVHILMVDYREYGRSFGEVSEQGTYLDAEAAFDYLQTTKPNPGKMIIYGQSLGAAVALELTLRRPVNALILEAPFLSIREMAKVHYGWLPVGGLITTQYDNIGKMGKVRVPVLILHGDRDETAPYTHGQRLFSAANEPKRLFTIVNAGHNDTYEVGGAAYLDAFSSLLGE
jgi:fermentation-respiration switch protein FrsA (DUF1100 family)